MIAALKDYETFLKNDLLPRSNGDFRLGAENFSKKLLYEEMVDIPLDRLLEIGYANLRENQQKFRETAAKIDPSKTPQQILDELEKDHPAPADLLGAFRDTVGKLRDFIVEQKIVTIPSPVLPILEETPPFMRALTFASMDTPGPYETVAKEAFFNVTLPEKDWAPDRVEDYMHSFNRGTILSTATHEAYPGHYVQFLWVQHVDSKSAQAAGRQFQRRRLGALLRADDARRRLRRRRPAHAPGPIAGRAAAQRALHRRNRDAHRQAAPSISPSSSSRRKATSRTRAR